MRQEELLRCLDIDYSYRLAKRLEQFRSHETLGYRPAGSRAEFDTGELLRAEMESLGLDGVCKDPVTVDGWEFRRAVLAVRDAAGERREIPLAAYQTTLVTAGFEPCRLVYLGRGTERDYEGVDVTGKLVLVDINQRDEWWINYPVYQAHLRGAKALIAAQTGGYGEIDDEALNAQDIAGPEDAPAFSISRRDAEALKALLREQGELAVELDADTRVTRGCTTYNISGRIPGRHPERMVLLSAHYDSYFSGFQDDNTGVAMMLGIARALRSAGFQPNNTIVFCAMAAEEWGVADSNFDWSAGAYEQVFTAHPEWVGRVIADLNFELPALAHGTRARIRSCYEYTRFLEEFLAELPVLTHAYPEETAVTAPIETWSDDFSLTIAGIPSMVNDFTGGSFMETNYHSQFDNAEFYDEQVYRLHHELFTLLIAALDRCAVVPLCFAPVLKRAAEGLSGTELPAEAAGLRQLLQRAGEQAETDYAGIEAINHRYAALLDRGDEAGAEALYQQSRALERETLARFKAGQDAFVRIDWYGNVRYPHELLLKNLRLLRGGIRSLEEGNGSACLRKLYQVDNNAYAFMFEAAVYHHFTDYVFHQPRERLKWGYGRLMQHENLYQTVQSLLRKGAAGETEFAAETATLRAACDKQEALLETSMEALRRVVQSHFITGA